MKSKLYGGLRFALRSRFSDNELLSTAAAWYFSSITAVQTQDARTNTYSTRTPRGSIYTTITELGPKIPYYRRNYGPSSLMVVYVDPLGLLHLS